jgi:hypothetical protein
MSDNNKKKLFTSSKESAEKSKSHLHLKFKNKTKFSFYFTFQPPSDGYLIDIVDNDWRQDELPFDQIEVPSEKLPDPEADGDAHLTLKEQVSLHEK